MIDGLWCIATTAGKYSGIAKMSTIYFGNLGLCLTEVPEILIGGFRPAYAVSSRADLKCWIFSPHNLTAVIKAIPGIDTPNSD